MSNYLSFENYTSEEYYDYIKRLPKKALLVALRSINKYKKIPFIKNFREESIKIELLQEYYFKEEKKGEVLLKNEILRCLDDFDIKNCLKKDEYELIKNPSQEQQEEYERVLIKLTLQGKPYLGGEDLIKLLNLNEELSENIRDAQSFANEKKKLQQLNKEVTSLKSLNERLEQEIVHLKATKQALQKDSDDQVKVIKEYEQTLKQLQQNNTQLQKQVLAGEASNCAKNMFQQLLNQIEKELTDYTYLEILQQFKTMDIKMLSLEYVYVKFDTLKKVAVKQNDLNSYNKISFIELMIMNVLEEINND